MPQSGRGLLRRVRAAARVGSGGADGVDPDHRRHAVRAAAPADRRGRDPRADRRLAPDARATDRPTNRPPPAHTTVIGMRFWPGAAPSLPATLDDLLDQHVQLSDLLGTSADRLAESVAGAPSAQHALVMLERHMLSAVRESAPRIRASPRRCSCCCHGSRSRSRRPRGIWVCRPASCAVAF